MAAAVTDHGPCQMMHQNSNTARGCVPLYSKHPNIGHGMNSTSNSTQLTTGVRTHEMGATLSTRRETYYRLHFAQVRNKGPYQGFWILICTGRLPSNTLKQAACPLYALTCMCNHHPQLQTCTHHCQTPPWLQANLQYIHRHTHMYAVCCCDLQRCCAFSWQYPEAVPGAWPIFSGLGLPVLGKGLADQQGQHQGGVRIHLQGRPGQQELCGRGWACRRHFSGGASRKAGALLLSAYCPRAPFSCSLSPLGPPYVAF